MFFVLVPVLFKLHYVLNNFFAQYNHTYLQQRASHGIHMKAAHTVLYRRFLSCNGHQLYEHGVDLEVEGVRYNYRDASRAGRVFFLNHF